MNKSLRHAKKAILQEMRMFPSLGLVSKHNNGSHHDMNYQTFKKSYFVLGRMLKQISLKLNSINNFSDLKKLGYEYEQLMFQKTKNVNTHKGLIFCLAIFWYAYLKVNQKTDFQELQNFIKNFSQELLLTDYHQLNTFGSKIYLDQKIKGARFMALNGYEVVFQVYDFYFHQLKPLNLSMKVKNFLLLLKMVTLIEDTTAIRKLGIKKYHDFQNEANILINESLQNLQNKILKKKIFSLNQKAIQANFSPGGAADLLVLVFFLIQENH